MRRSFAGMIYERVGLEKTSDALRHSSLETTRLYIKQRQDAAALAVEEAGLELR
jgi:integrase